MSEYNRHAEEEDQALTMFGLLIHRARMHRKVTRAELARRVGMKAARLREIEKGIGRSCTTGQLERIATALKMTVQFAAVPQEMVQRLVEHPVPDLAATGDAVASRGGSDA